MINDSLFEDIRIYLPKYLSDEDSEQLFRELSAFTEKNYKNFYTERFKSSSHILQGDLFSNILMPHYETKEFVPIKAMMISNSCQASLDNKKRYSPYITFAPVFSLSKWKAILLKDSEQENNQAIEAHIESIKAQKIASFFYIPLLEALGDECFVRFDCAFSIPLDQHFIKAILAQRLSTLNQTAFYLLILKLSIHFSRLQEKEIRGL